MKNKKLNLNSLMRIIEKALNLNKNQVNEESSSSNIRKWDSLGQLTILSALDDFYDGKIADLHNISKANSVKLIFSELKKNSLIKHK